MTITDTIKKSPVLGLVPLAGIIYYIASKVESAKSLIFDDTAYIDSFPSGCYDYKADYGSGAVSIVSLSYVSYDAIDKIVTLNISKEGCSIPIYDDVQLQYLSGRHCYTIDDHELCLEFIDYIETGIHMSIKIYGY